MDIGMREILIVLGCIIMAVLFVDAYRRVRDHRRSQLGYRLNDEPHTHQPATLDGFDDDEHYDDVTPVRPAGQSSGRIGHGHLQSGASEPQTRGSSNAEPQRSRSRENDKPPGRQAEGRATPKQIRVRISAPKHDVHTQVSEQLELNPKHHHAKRSNPDKSMNHQADVSEAVSEQDESGFPLRQSTSDGSRSVVKELDADIADAAKPAVKNKGREDLFPSLQQSSQDKKSDAPMKALLQPALATAPEAGDFYSNRRNSQASRSARQQQAQQQAQHSSSAALNPATAKPAAPSQPEEVIVMHVVAAKDAMFDGEVLVQQLLAANMRHGAMKIFHRFERPEQHQGVLFSMANMVKPGYFELDHMNAFETPGVTFFLTLPCPGGALYAYDLMVDTARKLSKALGGEMRDETQSMITSQTVEHYRQRVMEFERKQRMLEKTRQIRERSQLFD